nr:immunoglobulin heavy chain junction region [Mus musculus]
CARTTVVPDYW